MTKKSQNTQLATKRELKSEIALVRLDIKDVRLDLEKKIDNFQEALGAKLDKIANILDGFVGAVDDLRVENEVGTNQTRELAVKVDDHEKRIRQLESPSSV